MSLHKQEVSAPSRTAAREVIAELLNAPSSCRLPNAFSTSRLSMQAKASEQKLSAPAGGSSPRLWYVPCCNLLMHCLERPTAFWKRCLAAKAREALCISTDVVLCSWQPAAVKVSEVSLLDAVRVALPQLLGSVGRLGQRGLLGQPNVMAAVWAIRKQALGAGGQGRNGLRVESGWPVCVHTACTIRACINTDAAVLSPNGALRLSVPQTISLS